LVRNQPECLDSWDPQPFLTDSKGLRLLEEIARRIQTLRSRTHEQVDFLAFTLPGTLEGVSTIDGSSRLGIYDLIDVTAECSKLRIPPAYVFHDAECAAIGEILSGAVPNDTRLVPGEETFAYIVVDEGVGSSLFIAGHPYRGAGVAGHIGRLVMQPSGAFNPTFMSRGTLEVFAARPWVSQNVVNEYLAEKGKSGALPASSSSFRAAVEAASLRGNERKLTLQQLADGVNMRDPIVMTVLEEAAQCLSVAINAIITIVNPPLIMLGGGMISELPVFSQMLVSYARRNAWAGSWNETTIHITKCGRDAQILGAAHFLSQVVACQP
jgi:glucokinase